VWNEKRDDKGVNARNLDCRGHAQTKKKKIWFAVWGGGLVEEKSI